MDTLDAKPLTGKNIRSCENCHSPFKARSAKSPARFCSKICSSTSLQKRVAKTCAHCGAIKHIAASHADRATNFCCSKVCSLAFRAANPHLRGAAISKATRNKWANDVEWAAAQRLRKSTNKKPKIVVYVATDAPIVRYPYFNAVGRFCSACNRTILDRPGNRAPHVFCNRQCSGRWKADELVGPKSPRFKGGKNTLNCSYCKTGFQRHACFIGDFNNHFCSIAHRHAWQRDPANYIKNPHSTELWPNARDIEKRILRMDAAGENRVSAAQKLGITLGELTSFLKRLGVKLTAGRDYKAGEGHHRYQPRVEVACSQCLTVSKRAPWLVNDGPMYCSRKCLHRSKFKGGSVNYRGEDWSRQRDAARARDLGKCQLCGLHKGASIDVHHIRAFRMFTDSKQANNLRNLVSLCRSCHLKVEGTTNNGNIDTWQDEYLAHLKRKAAKLETRNRSRRLIFLTGQDSNT